MFELEQKVRLKSVIPDSVWNDQRRFCYDVKEVFGSETPVGIIKEFYNDTFLVDWGIVDDVFHKGYRKVSLPRPTGYWIHKDALELAYEPYDPDQECEDDCL